MAENSDQPKDWLLYPTGYVFQFDAQKDQKPALPDSERLRKPKFFETHRNFLEHAVQQFGFDSNSTELTFEEVELPISIGNGEIANALGIPYQSHAKTFLVKK